jgi:hypothetical protein
MLHARLTTGSDAEQMTMDRRLLYMFALLEAGMSALATLGGTIFMGFSPFYLGFGFGVVALYIVAGQAASQGRRWGLLTLIVCESVRLTGFGLSAMIGLLPWVELTLTGSTLTDGLILPGIVAVMAAMQLINRSPGARPPAIPQVSVTAETVSVETASVETASAATVSL